MSIESLMHHRPNIKDCDLIFDENRLDNETLTGRISNRQRRWKGRLTVQGEVHRISRPYKRRSLNSRMVINYFHQTLFFYFLVVFVFLFFVVVVAFFFLAEEDFAPPPPFLLPLLPLPSFKYLMPSRAASRPIGTRRFVAFPTRDPP